MLYDPKWEQKTEPLSLESLISWLEKQDASTQYDYTDPSACLITQWSGLVLNTYGVAALFGGEGSRIAQGRAREEHDANRWTFGAALKRARSVQGIS
jgi:hypothetical protein